MLFNFCLNCFRELLTQLYDNSGEWDTDFPVVTVQSFNLLLLFFFRMTTDLKSWNLVKIICHLFSLCRSQLVFRRVPTVPDSVAAPYICCRLHAPGYSSWYTPISHSAVGKSRFMCGIIIWSCTFSNWYDPSCELQLNFNCLSALCVSLEGFLLICLYSFNSGMNHLLQVLQHFFRINIGILTWLLQTLHFFYLTILR